MKKITLLLLLINSITYAVWSSFAHVTPDTEKEYELSIAFTSVKNKKNTYCVKLNAIDYDQKHAWLITATKELSPKEQNFRNFIWNTATNRKEKLTKNELYPKGKKDNLYYEIEISSNKICSSFIYIDFPSITFDGGYYYSIDLKSYLLKFEENNNLKNKEYIAGVILPTSNGHYVPYSSDGKATSGWTPTEKQIIKAQLIILKYIEKSNKVIYNNINKYRCQYFGIIVNGKKRIYCNFFWLTAFRKNWQTKPVIVDDGGNHYFQLEYDVETEKCLNFLTNCNG